MRFEIGSGELLKRRVLNAEQCMKYCQNYDSCKAFVFMPYYYDCALKNKYTVDHEPRKYTAYEFDMTCVRRQSVN